MSSSAMTTSILYGTYITGISGLHGVFFLVSLANPNPMLDGMSWAMLLVSLTAIIVREFSGLAPHRPPKRPALVVAALICPLVPIALPLPRSATWMIFDVIAVIFLVLLLRNEKTHP